jgi:hypothetical protein
MSLSTHDIERVEIAFGPGSAMYGPNAFAGVVNIITQQESTARPSLWNGYTGRGGYNASLRWMTDPQQPDAHQPAEFVLARPWQRPCPQQRCDRAHGAPIRLQRNPRARTLAVQLPLLRLGARAGRYALRNLPDADRPQPLAHALLATGVPAAVW